MSLRQIVVRACLVALIALPSAVRAQDVKASPCSDSLYLQLRGIPLDSLTPRQYEVFRDRDRACTQAQTAAVPAKPAKPAKPSKAHQGFWWGIDGGYGSAQPDCPQCVSEGTSTAPPSSESAGVFALRLGGTPHERLLLGGEIAMWGLSGARSVIGVLFISQVYPMRAQPLFVRLGVGVVGLAYLTQRAEINTMGNGVSGGVGYDFHLKRNVISPTVYWVRGTSMNTKTSVGVRPSTDEIKPTFVAFMVGFHRY